ncbi:putative uncharacterized protein binC [Aspergillus mulundensis]|uniref:Uncharacterized protein n=1 Tax=Aspergillus mulundensis TaxID=1810919 RepID=A0A3D8R407_9EURO|nr:putative uncharacterized protein binC [Aspergillus mulundensis]RDW68792.1 putative uncharacterized protein binC [Aspergillus mulundensis]
MRLIAALTTLLALAYAAPSMELEKASLDKRQQGENCIEVFFPDSCSSRGLVECDGAGSIRICCTRCY